MSVSIRRCRIALITLLAGLLWLPAAVADSPSPAVAATEAGRGIEPPVPMLWKLTAGQRHLYLLGSFHLLKDEDYPLSPDVTAIEAIADRLVLEIPPQELNSPQMPQKMLAAALRQDGTRLDSDLPPELAQRLRDWTQANAKGLKEAQIPPQVLQMFHPWFVGMTVSLVEMVKSGLDPELGLDQHMAGAAEGENAIPSVGLETADEQIALLAEMSLEQQLQFLDDALGNDEEQRQQELEDLHGLWRNGDVDGLWQHAALPMRDAFPDLYQRINVQRNDAWLPKLEALLADEQYQHTLVVVGALHLVGEDGVIEKLRARGHSIERICSACVAR